MLDIKTADASLPVYLKGAPFHSGNTSIIRYKKAKSRFPNPASSKMKDKDLQKYTHSTKDCLTFTLLLELS